MRLHALEHLHPIWFVPVMGLSGLTLAWWRARRSPTPLFTEHQNLVLDAGAGGFWIAMMAVNPLPSVAIATILLADRLAAGRGVGPAVE